MLEAGEKDGRTVMAAVFRAHLDRCAVLAIEGNPNHQVDYLVPSGPAMGAFNCWVKDTDLEDWRRRRVGQINRDLYEAADSPLPAYPFERRCHRFDVPAVSATAPQRLHALVLRNSSDLTEQSFESMWDARMPLVRQHTLRRTACVPAAAWVEVARFCYIASVRGASSDLVLEDVAWGEPMMLSRDAVRTTRTVLSTADLGRVDLDVLDGQDGKVLFQATAGPLRDERPPVLRTPTSTDV